MVNRIVEDGAVAPPSDAGDALTGFPGKTVVGAAALESIATDIEEGLQMRQVEPVRTASIVVVEMWAAVGHQGGSHMMGSLLTIDPESAAGAESATIQMKRAISAHVSPRL